MRPELGQGTEAFPGTLLEHYRNITGTLPEHYRNISGLFGLGSGSHVERLIRRSTRAVLGTCPEASLDLKRRNI